MLRSFRAQSSMVACRAMSSASGQCMSSTSPVLPVSLLRRATVQPAPTALPSMALWSPFSAPLELPPMQDTQDMLDDVDAVDGETPAPLLAIKREYQVRCVSTHCVWALSLLVL
eukprot:TRINITY_DN799_c0_g1_i2.p2 TRINITY_DN799_c0_g1~~TRINITY_DN799_c0_g1_i2.p2  ORF type:complete len:114 (-),score=34.80 TRINITY_DN799_c0_g1_i2:353-694(-)